MDKDYTETSDIYQKNSHSLQTCCWLQDFSKQDGLKPYLNTELHFLCIFSISSKLHLLHYMRKEIIRFLKQFPICSSCTSCWNKLWGTLTLAQLFSSVSAVPVGCCLKKSSFFVIAVDAKTEAALSWQEWNWNHTLYFDCFTSDTRKMWWISWLKSAVFCMLQCNFTDYPSWNCQSKYLSQLFKIKISTYTENQGCLKLCFYLNKIKMLRAVFLCVCRYLTGDYSVVYFHIYL